MSDINFLEAVKRTSLKTKEYGNNACSGALMGVQSGTVVSLDDVSPFAHKMSVCARSKNVLDINRTDYIKHWALTVEKNDNSIAISQNYAAGYCSLNFKLPIEITGKTITVSADTFTSGINKACLRVQWVSNTGAAAGAYLIGENYSGGTSKKLVLSGIVPEQPDEEHPFLVLMLYNNTAETLESGVTYTSTYSNIQVELGAVVTSYSPYVPSFAETPVNIYGKNLFDIDKVNGMYTSFSDLSNLLTRVGNGLRIPYGLYGASTYLTGQEVYLIPGVYQFSSKVTNNMSTTQSVKSAFYNVETKQYQNSSYLSIPNNSTALVQSTIIVENAGYYYFSMQGIGDASNYSQLDLIFTDIMFSILDDNLYEPFKEAAALSIKQEVKTQIDAIAPNITLIPADYGVILDVEYNKDANKVIEELTQAIISLGGRV